MTDDRVIARCTSCGDGWGLCVAPGCCPACHHVRRDGATVAWSRDGDRAELHVTNTDGTRVRAGTWTAPAPPAPRPAPSADPDDDPLLGGPPSEAW